MWNAQNHEWQRWERSWCDDVYHWGHPLQHHSFSVWRKTPCFPSSCRTCNYRPQPSQSKLHPTSTEFRDMQVQTSPSEHSGSTTHYSPPAIPAVFLFSNPMDHITQALINHYSTKNHHQLSQQDHQELPMHTTLSPLTRPTKTSPTDQKEPQSLRLSHHLNTARSGRESNVQIGAN